VDRDFVADVIGNVDPFSPQAQGAKIFDSVASHSIPFQCRQLATVTTDANGLAAIGCFPNLQLAYQLDNTWTATVVNTWGTPTVYPEAVSTLANGQYRVVSFGARIIGTVAPLNAQGVVSIFTMADFVPNNFDTGGSLTEKVTRVPLAGLNHTWVSKPKHGDSPVLPVGNTDSDLPGFTHLVVAVSGGPASTAVITVETCLNIEWYPNPGNAMTRISTPAAPHHIGRQMAIANTHAALPDVHHAQDNMGQKVLNALGGAVGTFVGNAIEAGGLSGVANYLMGNPTRPRRGRYRPPAMLADLD
jgi:hypothetical protein